MNSITCAFIGLGKMGRDLCGRIGGAGYRTLAYDLDPEASKYAEESYKNVTSSALLPAVKNSAVVFSCLPNSHHVSEVVNNLLQQEGTLNKVKHIPEAKLIAEQLLPNPV